MPRTRSVTARALASVCALTLVLAACGDDDGDTADTVEETTTTAADESTTTAADEPEDETTTAPEEETSTTVAGDSGDGTEGDPDAVALAQRINLTIEDFDDTWTETPAEEDDGGANLDDCFVETDIEASTVGEAETGTFTFDAPDGQSGQLVTMQTVVTDSADTAAALLAEAGSDAFITCAQDTFVGGFGEGAAVALAVRPDDDPWTEESFGLVGDITLPTQDGGTADGVMDLHLFRTGEVISFTATLDIGLIGIESTLGELYPVVAERHAAEVG
jgi:hypothetical protein